MIKKIETALKRYTARTGATLQRPRAVMFDMDGILFDSMPGHCKAWKQVCDENGIEAEADEFYAYEGRTGASTIDTLIRRQFGRAPPKPAQPPSTAGHFAYSSPARDNGRTSTASSGNTPVFSPKSNESQPST